MIGQGLPMLFMITISVLIYMMGMLFNSSDMEQAVKVQAPCKISIMTEQLRWTLPSYI